MLGLEDAMQTTSIEEIALEMLGQNEVGYFAVNDSGAGPGLLLVCDPDVSENSLLHRVRLFAQEGYAVLGLKGKFEPDDVINAANTLSSRKDCMNGLVCVAHGSVVTAVLNVAASFNAIVSFDASKLPTYRAPAVTECPVVFQFGTQNTTNTDIEIETARAIIDSTNGSRVYVWPEACPAFSLKGESTFDHRVDSLAHTRTLELVRRMVGPYYDYVELFAEHVRHEFETRDVDATMATMIEDPYVNHVATLAGGIGHDMLKRFYKYHFVNQNSRDRNSITVSHTPGPDRVVMELVVRFKHDQILDRYFPGIPPTQQFVELATVLIVKFRGDKVCHEHIYWDQGSALKQIGVLDADHLPVAGAEAARKVLDVDLPSNIFMKDSWDESQDKPV